MLKLTKDELKAIQARIKVLSAEHAELRQAKNTSLANLEDTGSYGQASQSDIDAAEHAGLAYDLWQEEFALELKNLESKVAHLPKPYFKLQSHI